MSGNRRNLAMAGIVVLATVAAMVLLLPSNASVAFDVRRSAQRTSPDGVAGWARSLASLERPSNLRFESFLRAPPSGTVEVLLEPIVAPTAAEVGALMSWVRAGGRLVYSPSFGGELLDSLDVSLTTAADAGDPRIAPHPWTAGLSAGDVPPTLESPNPRWLPTRHGVRTGDAGWEPLLYFVDAAADPPDTSDPAADATNLAAVGWLPVGDGGVLVVADGVTLANERVETSAEAVIVTRAVLEWTGPGDAIRFSEFHQGIRGSGSAVAVRIRRVIGNPVGRVTLWGVVWATLAIWALGRRFGSPIPQGRAPRRSPMEHVRALAEIYRQAGAERLVADRLVTGAARRAGLDTRLAVEPERALEWWTTHAERRDLAERSRLAWAHDPPDLPALSRALDQLVPAPFDP